MAKATLTIEFTGDAIADGPALDALTRAAVAPFRLRGYTVTSTSLAHHEEEKVAVKAKGKAR